MQGAALLRNIAYSGQFRNWAFRVWSTRAKHQRAWTGKNPLTENSVSPLPYRWSTQPPRCVPTPSQLLGRGDLTRSPSPPPGGRATRRQTRAQLGGGGVPYLGSAHPPPGRVPAPAARALAARPPPPPRDFAGMQAAADLASISSFPIRGINRPQQLARRPHQLPSPPWNPLPCSPSLQPEKGMSWAGGASEQKTCDRFGGPGTPTWGRGRQPPRLNRLGSAVPCRLPSESASVWLQSVSRPSRALQRPG